MGPSVCGGPGFLACPMHSPSFQLWLVGSGDASEAWLVSRWSGLRLETGWSWGLCAAVALVSLCHWRISSRRCGPPLPKTWSCRAESHVR